MPRYTAFLIVLALLAWRLIMPKPGLEASGPQTWIEIAFLIILYAYINLTGFGFGQFLLKRFDFPSLTKIEFVVLAYLLGFACLSAGVMVLGLAGWLNAEAVFFWIAFSGLIALREWCGTTWFAWAARFPRTKSPYLILLQIVIAASVPLLLLECLSPVWDYDALLYHLEVPRQFLAQEKFYFDPEVLRSAYPYLGEMLSVIGIVFKLDPVAKLMNLTYAVLFILSSYVFSRRFFEGESAYTTAGILIGAPAFWIWATWAGIDFAWASYEFWSVYSVSLWLAAAKRTLENG